MVVGSNLLFLISEELTLMLDQTLTTSMDVCSTKSTRSEFVRLNMKFVVLLCFLPLEAWALPLQLHTF